MRVWTHETSTIQIKSSGTGKKVNCLSDIKTSFLRPLKLFVFTKSTKSIKTQISE